MTTHDQYFTDKGKRFLRTCIFAKAALSAVLLTSCVTHNDEVTSTSAIDNTSVDVNTAVVNQADCGKTKGSFLDIWLDYYERGLSFMDCGMWQNAQDDLYAALNIRSIDKRRVYVRGMHAISDYFPHRELGITFFFQAMDANNVVTKRQYLDSAQKQLLISLSQFPSEKAEWYLNEIRRISSKDNALPVITSSWENGNLEVEISDDTFVEKVWLNGAPYYWNQLVKIEDTEAYVFVEKAEKTAKFRIPENILQQTGEVDIEAADIFGKKNYEQLKWTVANREPELLIQTVTPGPLGRWMVKGVVSDPNSTLKTVMVDNQSVSLTDPYIATFDVTLNYPKLKVYAKNDAEEELRKTIDVSELGFKLELTGLPASTQLSQVLISGEARSEQGLKRLVIGDKSIDIDGKLRRFSHQMPLLINQNTIPVQLFDHSEREPRVKNISIERKVLPQIKQSESLKLALFPFKCNLKVGLPCKSTEKHHELLEQELRLSERFQLADRGKFREQFTHLIRCDDGVTEACAWLINDHPDNRLKAEAMLVGETIERPLYEKVNVKNYKQLIGIESSVKVINADMGGKIVYFDSYQESKVDAAISEQLASKVLQQFTLFTTQNIKVKGKTVEVYDSLNQMWEKQPVNIFKGNKKCTVGRVEEKSEKKATVEMKSRCKGQLKVVSS